MTKTPPPDNFDYDNLSAQVRALAEAAIAAGADPEFTAASIFQDSFDIAFASSPDIALRHILFAMDRTEEDMQKFHDRFGDTLDLNELVHGRIVPKASGM